MMTPGRQSYGSSGRDFGMRPDWRTQMQAWRDQRPSRPSPAPNPRPQANMVPPAAGAGQPPQTPMVSPMPPSGSHHQPMAGHHQPSMPGRAGGMGMPNHGNGVRVGSGNAGRPPAQPMGGGGMNWSDRMSRALME
jgi:hypothetical protein